MKHFGKIRANIIWISTYLLCLNNFEGAISSFAQDSHDIFNQRLDYRVVLN